MDAAELSEWILAGAGILMLGLAGWLLALSPRQRATRAFALVLALTGALSAILRVGNLWPSVAMPAQQARAHVLIWLTAATFHFLCVYPRPRGWVGHARHGWAVFAAPALAISLAVLADFRLWAVFDVAPDGSLDYARAGPLNLVYALWSVVAGLLLLALARDYVRASPGPYRRSLALVFVGYMLYNLTWCAMLVVNDLGRRLSGPAFPTWIDRVEYLADEALAATALVALALVAWRAARAPDAETRREGALVVAACALPTAVALLTVLGPAPAPGDWFSGEQWLVDALATLAFPVLTTYALLKHRLFDIDVKVKWTISRGTVAAVFLGVFFVAAQLAQNFFEESMGWALGGVTAGLLLFAITPIQRIAERVANAAMPHVDAAPPGERGPRQRAEVYRLALAMALCDRSISRDEERHLARLADELGLPSAEALTLRETVEREMGLAA